MKLLKKLYLVRTATIDTEGEETPMSSQRVIATDAPAAIKRVRLIKRKDLVEFVTEVTVISTIDKL